MAPMHVYYKQVDLSLIKIVITSKVTKVHLQLVYVGPGQEITNHFKCQRFPAIAVSEDTFMFSCNEFCEMLINNRNPALKKDHRSLYIWGEKFTKYVNNVYNDITSATSSDISAIKTMLSNVHYSKDQFADSMPVVNIHSLNFECIFLFCTVYPILAPDSPYKNLRSQNPLLTELFDMIYYTEEIYSILCMLPHNYLKL